MKKISNILNKCNLFNKIANEEELTEGQKYYDIYSEEENLVIEIKNHIRKNNAIPEELYDRLKEIRKELYKIDHNKDPEKYPSPEELSDKITKIKDNIEKNKEKINRNNKTLHGLNLPIPILKGVPVSSKQAHVVKTKLNTENSELEHELFDLKDKHKTLLQIQSYLSGSIY